MTIRDKASGETGALTFTGYFTGELSAHRIELENHFTGPTEQKIDLGHHIYDVTLGAFSPPGPPRTSRGASSGAPARGAFSAHVNVYHNPEPSALILAALGALGGAAALRRKGSWWNWMAF
jgi:hypothetical protein